MSPRQSDVHGQSSSRKSSAPVNRTRTDSSGEGPREAAKEMLNLEVEDRQNLIETYEHGAYQPSVSTDLQTRALAFAVSVPWLVVQVVAILTDVTVLILEFISGNREWWYLPMAQVISVIYLADIALRVYGLGPQDFFRQWRNWFDFIVVLFTAILTFASSGPDFGEGLSFFRMVRYLRLARVFYLGINGRTKLTAARRVTGENKLRFVSAEHDLDLDLCYTTPNLITMSVPAEDCITRLYRNDIREVVRFFELYHASHFHIINTCPEIKYNHSAFGKNLRTHRMNVTAFNVQDHTPPLIHDFVRFFKVASEWMSEDAENVLAVHCRGGKGRTGSFCCGWLLYNGEAETAQDALNIFALARTDLDQQDKKIKLQGVETPSQRRYVYYIAQLLLIEGPVIQFPQAVPAPRKVMLNLSKLEINNMIGQLDGRQLIAAVHTPRAQASDSEASWQIIQSSAKVDAQGSMSFDLGGIEVSEDVRISVFEAVEFEEAKAMDTAGKHILAGKEPGCEFYFLFHTYFHKDDDKVEIPCIEVDKAFKSSKYNKTGSLTVHFAAR